MTRITNGDQIALALQARLKRLKKQDKSSANDSAAKVERRAADKPEPLKDILSDEELDENTLTRRVVGRLLEDEFGADFAKDHRFATIINRVSDIILRDEGSSEILKQALTDLKGDAV